MKEIISNPDLVAYCGLYCGACTRYRAIREPALAEKLAQALGIENISASQVSEINKGLESQVEHFRNRALSEEYLFLWIDAHSDINTPLTSPTAAPGARGRMTPVVCMTAA